MRRKKDLIDVSCGKIWRWLKWQWRLLTNESGYLYLGRKPYFIERKNLTRPFKEIIKDMRQACCVVVMGGERSPQMKVEINVLLTLRDIHIWWRPSEKTLKSEIRR